MTIMKQAFRRSNGNYEFWDKKWDEYENGFMDSVGLGEGGNSWIGLKAISDLTADESWLRVELRQDRAPNSKYANEYWFEEYDFGVNDASTNYSLRISIDWRTHIGNASSGWFDITVNNGRPFSTVDRINDPHKPCVTERHLGGWWLYYCSLSSLNGEYIPKEYASGYGMAWVVMGEYTINPGSSIMMVKRK
ncbi:hypothetical protein AB6A40_007566 [Gnathostoma spinigerum]|uniref:Fibrinogen C-terminal domain-containing protein n=1 Tax=Gnathostoma spinigerum TaxID=75299 RepID=A0ABD6EWA1_9BILA